MWTVFVFNNTIVSFSEDGLVTIWKIQMLKAPNDKKLNHEEQSELSGYRWSSSFDYIENHSHKNYFSSVGRDAQTRWWQNQDSKYV